jgi:hypothetical protein
MLSWKYIVLLWYILFKWTVSHNFMFEINNMTPLFIEFPFEYVFLCNNKNQMRWWCKGIIKSWLFKEKNLCCIECTLPWAGFELTTLMVIGTDCINSCKSNYHTTTTTTVPLLSYEYIFVVSSNPAHGKVHSIQHRFFSLNSQDFIIPLHHHLTRGFSKH